MRKSWKPQVRSFFINRIPFWIFLFFVTVAICFYFYSINKSDYLIYSVLIYFGTAFCTYHYVKRWNMGGYEKITIDTNKNLVVFDDKVKIHSNEINYIECTIENNPNTPFLFRKDIYDNGRIDIFKINATLTIQTINGNYVRFAIQNKFAMKQILKTFNKMGFEIDVTDERTINIALLVRIIIVIVCLIALLFIYVTKSHI